MHVETAFHLIAPGREADVAAWTGQLGLIPSAFAVRGQRAGSAPSPDSWWAYTLDKQPAETTEQPLLALLEVLAPFQEQIKALAAAHELEVSVTSYVWEPVQGLVADLQASTLARLAQLGCSYAVVAYE